ncbi:MAG: NTP transferase domain-containing protein [Novosphingobium sp.]
MAPFNALILAGSRGEVDPVSAYAGVSHKALIELGGLTLLECVVLAVRAAGAARIAVVTGAAPVAELAARLGCEVLPQAPGPSASAAAGLALLGAPLLVTTADHALLRPEWIVDLVSRTRSGADVSALMARRETIEASAPPMRRTYFRLADGDWSGCNLFFLATGRSVGAIHFWQRVEQERKHPWRLARMLGAATLLRYVSGRLSLTQAVERIGRKAAVSAQVVESPFGLAALDIDKPDDLDVARSVLLANSAGG